MVTVEAATETITRDELLHEIDELSAPLDYGPGEFLAAVDAGTVPDTPEASGLLVLIPLRAIDTIDNLTKHPDTGGRVDHGPHTNPR